MLLIQLAIHLVLLMIPAAYLAVGSLAAIWLVFGHTQFLVRTIVYLLVCVLMGLLPHQVDSRAPDIIGHTTIGMTVVAAAAALLRWLDFRLVTLTGGIHRETAERETGKTIDEWYRELNGRVAKNWSHSKICNFVRQQGVLQEWPSVIATSYEIYIGRRAVERTDTRELLFVVPKGSFSPSRLLNSVFQQRSSIRQLALACVFVAGLSSVIRAIPLEWISVDQLVVLAFVAIFVAWFTLFAAVQGLSIEGPNWRMWMVWLVLSWPLFFAAKSVGLQQSLARLTVLPAELIYVECILASVWVSLAVLLVRQHGYRIALVDRGPQNLWDGEVKLGNLRH